MKRDIKEVIRRLQELDKIREESKKKIYKKDREKADKAIELSTELILDHLGWMSSMADSGRYVYDKDKVIDAVRRIDDSLKYLKQSFVIESEGMKLTEEPEARQGEPLPVVCIETGKVYDTITQAAEETGINSGNISLAVRGIIPAARGFHWAPYIPEEGRPLPVKKKRSRSVRVLCIETGTVYKSVTEAALASGASKTGISQCLNGKAESAGGLHWMRADGEGKPIE